MAKLVSGDFVSVRDSGAATAAAITALASDAKVDEIDTADNTLTINSAQAVAADSKLVTGDAVTVSDTAANIVTNLTALASSTKVDTLDASDNTWNLSATQFATLTGATNAVVAASDTVRVTASTGADTFDLNDANLGTATLNVVYTAANQAKVGVIADVAVGGGLNDTDTITFASAVDSITNFTVATDKLDLSAFNVVQAAQGLTLADGTYFIVQGTATSSTVFTADSVGTDTLVVWDGNTTGGSVTIVGTVLTGVGGTFSATDIL